MFVGNVDIVCDRRNVLARLSALGAALALPRLALAAESVGEVSAERGRSTGLLEGELRELKTGAEVFLTELVETGMAARLTMALGESTTVRLGERTRLTIEKRIVEHGGQLLLERGALLFDRPDSGEREDAVVRTPLAIIAARGTSFFVGPSQDVVGVFVERGTVTVRNNAGSVELTAGEGTDLTSPDVAPTPPAVWGAPRIAAAFESVS
jgi:ferric-dicitrate binding protein FerR (iron transport regulator)